MNVDAVIAYCLAKPGAEESYPFGEHELVAKVGGKGFAFIGLAEATVAVKCGPTAEQATELRERYPSDVRITSHIGRYGWNTVTFNGAISADEVRELLDGSYAAVVAKLPKAKRPVSGCSARSSA